MEMQLVGFITWLLVSFPLPSLGETIGHVTRDYFGDIFTLGDCEPGSCDQAGRRAAQIPGERCRCQCAPSHYTFREDMRQCIKDVGECPVAMFVRPFAVERIPLVFLPMTGQLVYPGAHLTVSGIARLAPSRHLSCNVKSSLLMTSHGWQPIRTPVSIFGVYYDGNKTFLQWLGDDEERRKLQHHLVLIRLTCEGENSNGTFEPCAALRIGWAPGLGNETSPDTSTGKNNYVIIGLCLGILGLIYVGAVLIYLKVRKGRRTVSRQGLAPSRTTIESNDDEEANGTSQARSVYISNLVQEAELTSKKSSTKGGVLNAPENGLVSSNRGSQSSEASSSGSSPGVQMTNNPLYEKHATNDSTDSPSSSSAQPASPEFFLRIRNMISAAKNRLNSFRYRPTLLVIPEDDYFYQDFKERDIDITNGEKKSLGRRLAANKSSKMESIHGSHLGAAMLGSKVAPPLPPPRQVKCKSKKKAPSPPEKRGNYPLADRYESTSPQSREVNGDCDPGSTSSPADGLSKFDIFRLDLYEKINRIRDGSREQNAENGIVVLDGVDEKEHTVEDGTNKVLEGDEKGGHSNELCEITGRNSQKISRRQLIHKIQEGENGHVSPSREASSRNSNEEAGQRSKSQTPTAMKVCGVGEEDDDDDDDWASSHAGSVVEERDAQSVTPLPYSRPGTASSNRSLPTSTSSAHPTSDSKGRRKSTLRRGDGGRRKKQKKDRQESQEEYDGRSEIASLSGDSLNSSFRRPSKSPSSMKSKRSRKSVDDDLEDTSVISSSSILTTSTAIKELQDDYDDDDVEEDYDETMDEEDSRFSTDLDTEDFSLDESEHPSLEEYLQLSSQVAKKLSERTVPAFNANSQREKNVLTQFMKEFKTTIGRLRTVDEPKPRITRPSSPGADNWTLRKEEKAKSAKVARKVSIFKRNPLKSRKHHSDELLAEEDIRKMSGYYDNAGVSETDDTVSCFSDVSSLSGGPTKGRSKTKTPEIVPAGKMMTGGEKTIIAIKGEGSQAVVKDHKPGLLSKAVISNGVSIPRIGKAVTPPLPPPKPSLEQLQAKAASLKKGDMTLRRSQQQQQDKLSSSVPTIPNGDLKQTKVTTLNRKANKSPARLVRSPSFDSDSISVANSDMTEDSLNTPIPRRDDREDEEDDAEEDGPIDRALEQLADSVIQPPDDCSLNRYLSHLGTVLAAREDNALDQCLNKLASNMNGSRATKGFNLSQHLPLGTWEHVCVDRVTSDRSTPTSDVSSTSRGSRSSQEHLRKKTLTKPKHHHHHHHHRAAECKHGNGHVQDHPQVPGHGNHASNHLPNGRLQAPVSGNDSYTTRINVERSVTKPISNGTSRNRITSISEDDTESRASSLGSTREQETATPVSETTSDPSSVDLERSRKRRPLGRRGKKALNGTCRQHIQSSRLGKDGDHRTLRKTGSKQKSSDVTVIQLEGDPTNHVTNVESTNTFVTLINVDSSDCSNSAEEK